MVQRNFELRKINVTGLTDMNHCSDRQHTTYTAKNVDTGPP